jgi:hypothetical protein
LLGINEPVAEIVFPEMFILSPAISVSWTLGALIKPAVIILAERFCIDVFTNVSLVELSVVTFNTGNTKSGGKLIAEAFMTEAFKVLGAKIAVFRLSIVPLVTDKLLTDRFCITTLLPKLICCDCKAPPSGTNILYSINILFNMLVDIFDTCSFIVHHRF